MRSPRVHARRLVALAAALTLAASFVGTASAAVDPQVTCIRSAPRITFSSNPVVMAPSGQAAFMKVTITDMDSPGCTAFQTFEWQWQPKKVSGATGISAALVGNSGWAIRSGGSFTTAVRIYAFAPVGSTARYSFTVVRMDKPDLTPATAYFGVQVSASR
jgi:hypothetical protein